MIKGTLPTLLSWQHELNKARFGGGGMGWRAVGLSDVQEGGLGGPPTCARCYPFGYQLMCPPLVLGPEPSKELCSIDEQKPW